WCSRSRRGPESTAGVHPCPCSRPDRWKRCARRPACPSRSTRGASGCCSASKASVRTRRIRGSAATSGSARRSSLFAATPAAASSPAAIPTRASGTCPRSTSSPSTATASRRPSRSRSACGHGWWSRGAWRSAIRWRPSSTGVHPELDSEQAYVDHAYACLEEMRRRVERAGDAAIGEVEALVLEAWAAKRLVTFEDAERGLCFGRLDLDGIVRPLYVGRRWVHEEQTPIVVNWQAPAARPFYTATVAKPQGVELRRRFRTDGRRLLDLYDEPLDGSAGDVVHGVADILLEELERSRDEHMRDIVATIQTDQYRLITREPEGALVIQGGPGTGKTAVGLHRASWLLYTYRRQLERSGVLVVGPNPVFMDYISHVLPMLGEERVEQCAVSELAGVEPARREEPALARLKGDARLADVI